MNNKNWRVLSFLMFVPFLIGGGTGDDGCSCGNDPEVTYYQPSGQDGVPTDCLPFIDDSRDEHSCPLPACDEQLISAEDLATLQGDLSEARAELARLGEIQSEEATQSSQTSRVIRTVTIESGRWIGQYVADTPGATLAATRECNGFTERNPTVYSGDRIDICGP